MSVEQEYLSLCQNIDQVQWQMFKQGKRNNEFLRNDLNRLQGQLQQLILIATGRLLHGKPKDNTINKPNRREDICYR